MRVKLRPIGAYEVLDGQDRVVKVLFEAGSWEGMSKLKAEDGQTLIIESPGILQESMARAMAPLGGDLGMIERNVLKASPELVPYLRLIEAKA